MAGFMAEFPYDISYRTFLVRFHNISGSFGLATGSGSISSPRQNTSQGSTKLASYTAEATEEVR